MAYQCYEVDLCPGIAADLIQAAASWHRVTTVPQVGTVLREALAALA